MAAQKVVVEGSSVTALQLKDLFLQFADGSLNGDHVQAFLEHRDPFASGRSSGLTLFDLFDPITIMGSGWGLVEDRESLPKNWDSSKVTLESALKPGERTVTGKDTLKRFSKKPLLGARAFQFYCNNKHLIPNEWRGKFVFFDATVLLGPQSDHYSLSLCSSGGAWGYHYGRLDSHRRAHDLSAVLAS